MAKALLTKAPSDAGWPSSRLPGYKAIGILLWPYIRVKVGNRPAIRPETVTRRRERACVAKGSAA